MDVKCNPLPHHPDWGMLDSVHHAGVRLATGAFRCLHKSGGALQYTPVKYARIMIGCIFLHNRCVLRGIPLPQEQQEAEDNEDIGDVYVPVDADLESGKIVREEEMKYKGDITGRLHLPVTKGERLVHEADGHRTQQWQAGRQSRWRRRPRFKPRHHDKVTPHSGVGNANS
ncbi:hypothetical protein GWK47_039915 [Chionoecetes opilio]|uniref:Nuclease HARBI1 n=1 Tax=Chionoecetes opilio TaxID=41210 RepID=A0A8J5CXV6_CHIOP|nr:hypothetical protein GWK47_039915 [Chionoecetes opilio]